jgi:hypothetical protein
MTSFIGIILESPLVVAVARDPRHKASIRTAAQSTRSIDVHGHLQEGRWNGRSAF